MYQQNKSVALLNNIKGKEMKNLPKRSTGFTLVELIIVIVIIVIVVLGGYVFLMKTVCQGNFWFSGSSVLRELQLNHPNVVKVLKTERNVFDNSVITVEDKEGVRQKHCLDTDILWNYDFPACTK
ncbi:prepilin-type N-terminal cleavage/methylation domain-containing protein [Patescibacteria group bacterium]